MGERKIYDVAIIGGGLSGLFASYRLKQMAAYNNQPISTVILEANHRIGGRVETDEGRRRTTEEERREDGNN